MKIRFLNDTYIRQAPRVGGKPPIGVVYKGTEISVLPEPIPGDSISNNNLWYCDQRGWYFWSGATQVIKIYAPLDTNRPDPAPVSPDMEPKVQRNIFNWPKQEASSPDQDKEDTHDRSIAENPITETIVSQELPIPPMRNPLAQVWENPPESKLNWPIRSYAIARDWWQDKRLTGKNVRLAILSTGYTPQHPDLPQIDAFFAASPLSNELVDDHGLGTQAAVIAAGRGQNIFGVAPEATLMIGKIGQQDHLIRPEDLIEGLEWAINAKADIIAMLVDFTNLRSDQETLLQQLIHAALDRNIWLLAPVGNSDGKKPQSFYPAKIDGVISVGAHDQFGQWCPFSAKSYHLDFLAPGDNLKVSTIEGRQVASNRTTAIATAFTAGLLALIRQHKAYSHQEIYDLLKQTAISKQFIGTGQSTTFGYGLLNPIGLLDQLS